MRARAGQCLTTALLLSGAAACRSAPPAPSPLRPVIPRIPRDAPRFEITEVTDSTAVIQLQEAQWVRVGMQSYAVDPHQRDALVARLRVIARDSATATALITSQVARVKPEHALLMIKPRLPWWKSSVFWWGGALGAALGASLSALW